jgi:hypothetical protein
MTAIKKNEGKKFEQDFMDSFPMLGDIFTLRLKDSSSALG